MEREGGERRGDSNNLMEEDWFVIHGIPILSNQWIKAQRISQLNEVVFPIITVFPVII